MRPLVRAYVALVILAALLLAVGDGSNRDFAWIDSHAGLLLILIVLCALAEHVTFQVHSGWATHAGTVPHLAAAVLVPPGIASLVAAIGMLVYVINRRQVPIRASFNTASQALSVGVAGLVIRAFGSTDVMVEPGWRGPVAALVASTAYYLVSATTVACVVAIDQRRPLLQVLEGKIGVKTLVEIGLGLIGATFAILVLTAPGFAPALAVPAFLVYLAKRAIDRGAAQARNLELTNAVGRAVAGTLNFDQALDAITDRAIRDTLRLSGLAVMPLGIFGSFEPRVATDLDQPALRHELARRIREGEGRAHLHRPDEIQREWIDQRDGAIRVVAAALPCRVGQTSPSAALVTWRAADRAEPFTDGDLLLLETLADYVAVALETTRLFDEAIAGRQDAEQRETRIQAVMQNVADGLLTFHADGVVESANPAAERIFDMQLDMLTGQPVARLLPDLLDPTTSVAVWPDDGRVIKRELDGLRADGGRVPLEVTITGINQADAPRFIAVVRDVSERQAFEQQLRHMAFHDPLTGLPNRALFMDRIEHAMTVANDRGRSIGVLFLDLDNFKVVNDSLGHATGDQLLVEIAARLRSCVGPLSTLARFGGDEFTVLLDDDPALAGPDVIAERLRASLEQPFMVADREVYATLSIGIAVSTPGVESAGDLLRNADVAMYRAKSGGRARSVVFDRGVDSSAVERLELETELRGAIERGELELHYQPIIDIGTGGIDDFEALIRWRHPRDGLIPPDQFIPLAEETGLIIPIGQWVLETACTQLKTWHRMLGHDDLSVSVNISPRQFQHRSLPAEIARVLRMVDLPARCLTIEVIESLAMRDAGAAAAILAELKQLGVGVAIDDFGTGYSSLSYLHRFPCDVLKIDRSFVSRLGRERQDQAIVEAIVAIAHALEMAVIAEGIETGEQLARLRALGCERGQGYYFSRPVQAASASELLRAQGCSTIRQLRAA